MHHAHRTRLDASHLALLRFALLRLGPELLDAGDPGAPRFAEGVVPHVVPCLLEDLAALAHVVAPCHQHGHDNALPDVDDGAVGLELDLFGLLAHRAVNKITHPHQTLDDRVEQHRHARVDGHHIRQPLQIETALAGVARPMHADELLPDLWVAAELIHHQGRHAFLPILLRDEATLLEVEERRQ
jgi:hypothetical protein